VGIVPRYGNPFLHGVRYQPPPPRTDPAILLPYHQAPSGVRRTVYAPLHQRPPVRAAGNPFGPVPQYQRLPSLQQQAYGMPPAFDNRSMGNREFLNIDPRLVDLPPPASPVTTAPAYIPAPVPALQATGWFLLMQLCEKQRKFLHTRIQVMVTEKFYSLLPLPQSDCIIYRSSGLWKHVRYEDANDTNDEPGFSGLLTNPLGYCGSLSLQFPSHKSRNKTIRICST
jgi:hypothetical protein